MSLRSFSYGLAIPLALLTFTASASFAQAPPPSSKSLPIHQEFLKSDNGWIAVGSGGTAAIATSPESINNVRGALQMDYNVAPGNLAFLMMQTDPGLLTKARKFRFSVRTDYATTLALVLQEKDGGRYLAYFAVPKDTWQKVELAPEDFTLSDGPGDPKDPDNRLDLDQVSIVGIIDVVQALAQGGGPAGEMFGIKTGPHKLYLADVDITATIPAPSTSLSTTLDDFSHPQLDWLMLGTVRGESYSRGLEEGHGMQMKYDQAPAKISGALHTLHPHQLTSATRIAFSVASTQAATLIVQLEENGGGKYNSTVYVPAGASSPSVVSIPFADFKEADDSKDTNHKLDLNQVNHVIFIDATGLMGKVTEATPNTLYVADLHVVR